MLPRSKITLEAQAAKKELRTIERGDQKLRVGIITVPSFYQDYNARAAGSADFRSTTRDVRKLLEEFDADGGIDGLVLDLRENGGGHLTEAIDLVNLFVPKGPVVQLRETGGRVEVLESETDRPAYEGPLTILVDRFSASASEIFAAAMQDYGRGVIIGQETYGKGTVQNLYPLDRYAIGQDPGYGQLTVTIGMYYRVTGDSTQNRGVQPDIRLPSAISPEEVGESSREAALPWNRIRPARFASSTSLGPLIADLTQRHDQRIATDPEFQEAVKEIETIEVLRSQKTVSLNLEKRREERAALNQQRRVHPDDRRSAEADADAETEAAENLDALDELPDALLTEATEITADLTEIEPRYVARNRTAN
jgi:carboxyl-terminal processing protease